MFPANLPWRPNKLRGSSATQRSASYYYHLSTRRALRETKLVPLGPSYSRFPRILTIFLSVSGVWSVGGGEDTSPVNIWSIVRYFLLICDIIIFFEIFFQKSIKNHNMHEKLQKPQFLKKCQLYHFYAKHLISTCTFLSADFHPSKE